MEKKNSLAKLLIAISFLITLLLIFSSTISRRSDEIIVDGVSPDTYKATRNVVDTITTEKLRTEAYNNIEPVYQRKDGVIDSVSENLATYFESITEIRNTYKSILIRIERLETEIADLTARHDSGELEETDYSAQVSRKNTDIANHKKNLENLKLDENFPFSTADRQKQYILEISDSEFNEIITSANDIINDAYEGDVPENKSYDAIIAQSIRNSNSFFSDNLAENLVTTIVSHYMEPNRFIDEEQTEKARLQKAEDVPDVMYQSGQLIVTEGEIITEEIYAVLNELGFIGGDYNDYVWVFVGSVFVVVIVLLLVLFYLTKFPLKNLKTTKGQLMLFTIYILSMGFIFAFSVFSTSIHLRYTIPILVFVLLTAILFDKKFAIIMNICLATLAILISRMDYSIYIYFILSGIILSLLSDMVAENRSNSIIFSFFVGAMNCFLIFGVCLLAENTDYKELLTISMVTLLNGILTVIIALGSLPAFEAVFDAETTTSLLALTNPNNELIQRLTREAPGTYHHSLIVANLGEAAAKAVGANSIIVRVGSYFHDIGKLKYPGNFSENIVGDNPHDVMDAYDSAKIIKEHVTYGLELAEEMKLPEVVKDTIKMHHGNTVITYFYNKALNDPKYKDKVLEQDFRYEGSPPTSKELGIVMLADTVEAAVRSKIPHVDNFDEIKDFIKCLVDKKIKDGQLQETQLTLKDIDLIIESFYMVFKGMYHERIAYPGDEKKGGDAVGTEKVLEEKLYNRFKELESVLIVEEIEGSIRMNDTELVNRVIFNAIRKEKIDFDVEIGIKIVADEIIKDLNNKHRNVDEVTDVLSFPSYTRDEILGLAENIESSEIQSEESLEDDNEQDESKKILLGDIVIGLNAVKKQASEYGHSFERELAFLAVHGTLHLLGYDHLNVEEERVMFLRQEEILNEMGISR